MAELKEGKLEVVPTPEKKKTKKIKIAELTIGRCDTGLELYVKSPVLEEFIKKAYGGRTADARCAEWSQGKKFYVLGSGLEHPEVTASRFTITLDGIDNQNLLDRGEVLNMSFLRIVGIKDGKTFKFAGLFRESDIESIAQSINEGLKTLFKEYNTPTAYEIEVIAEE